MTKIALVTGAGSGIGRAAALALMEAGFALVLAGRRKDALDETKAMAPAGAAALVVPTDIRNEAEVAALFKTAIDHYGRLDVLFNNAGAALPPTPIDELSLASWNELFAVNVTGAFLCARAAFAQMRAQSPQGGRIINNGSISAQTPRPLSAAYTASKHAITGLTKSLLLDGRAFDIAASQIDIGNAATAMTSHMVSALQPDGRVLAEPTFDVADVARTIAHVAALPPGANIAFLTIIANKMPFAGRG